MLTAVTFAEVLERNTKLQRLGWVAPPVALSAHCGSLQGNGIDKAKLDGLKAMLALNRQSQPVIPAP